MRKKTNVLVHCAAGISRCSTLLVAYMMQKYRMSFDECLSKIQSARQCCQPNMGFVKQLRKFEIELGISQAQKSWFLLLLNWCILIFFKFYKLKYKLKSIKKISKIRIWFSSRVIWRNLTKFHVLILFLLHEFFDSLFSVFRQYLNLRTTFLKGYPFEMVINGKDWFHNNNECGIKSDSNQDNTTIRIGSLWNYDIDVKEDKCHDTVVKEPKN